MAIKGIALKMDNNGSTDASNAPRTRNATGTLAERQYATSHGTNLEYALINAFLLAAHSATNKLLNLIAAAMLPTPVFASIAAFPINMLPVNASK